MQNGDNSIKPSGLVTSGGIFVPDSVSNSIKVCIGCIALIVSLTITITDIISLFTFTYPTILLLSIGIITLIMGFIEFMFLITNCDEKRKTQLTIRIWCCAFTGELILFCVLLVCWLTNKISGTLALEILECSWVSLTLYISIMVDINATRLILCPELLKTSQAVSPTTV